MLVILLKDLLNEEQVRKYIAFFSILVFYEKQAEAYGGGESGEIGANLTLKNLSEMTAAFGPKSMTAAFGSKH